MPCGSSWAFSRSASFGLGLIFILAYFFAKYWFLIVYSKSNAQIVRIKEDGTAYREFMAAALAAAEQHKGGLKR